jgi:hypothetical protein
MNDIQKFKKNIQKFYSLQKSPEIPEKLPRIEKSSEKLLKIPKYFYNYILPESYFRNIRYFRSF